MSQAIGLLTLHVLCLYFLRLLWNEKTEAIKRGKAMTKMGLVTRRKSPRLFFVSIWVDFIVLSALYIVLIVYSVALLGE